MPNCIKGILNCFTGNHINCDKFTSKCKQHRRYVYQYLAVHCRNNLKFTDEDKAKLYRVIYDSRVSDNYSVHDFRQTEAMNGAFRTTNPKHRATFSRNAKYRDHSAIHMTNNGPGESISMKMEATGLTPQKGDVCIKTLLQMQHARNMSFSADGALINNDNLCTFIRLILVKPGGIP